MRLYNINPVKQTFEWGEMTVVVLGEEGRGRKKILVPFHAPEGLDDYDTGFTKTGRIKIVADRNTPCKKGWIARICSEGVYTRGTYGTAYVHKDDVRNIEVLEEAWGAYGDAGRIGTWMDYLVKITKCPTRILVRPSGGPAKIERYWLVFTDDKVYKLYNKDIDVFVETVDIDVPPVEESIPDMEANGLIVDLDRVFKEKKSGH